MEEQKILEQKSNSLYEIFMGFLIVDWDIEESEVDELMLGLSENLEKTNTKLNANVSFQEVIKKIAEDPDNFAKNAVFLNMVLTREEKVNILLSISSLIFADDNFSDKEYELYIKLMQAWKIEKSDLQS